MVLHIDDGKLLAFLQVGVKDHDKALVFVLAVNHLMVVPNPELAHTIHRSRYLELFVFIDDAIRHWLWEQVQDFLQVLGLLGNVGHSVRVG